MHCSPSPIITNATAHGVKRVWPAVTSAVCPSGRIQLWGHAIAVDWAEPEVEVDEDTMATVKILYVRNLMLQTTEEIIEKEFNSIKPGD